MPKTLILMSLDPEILWHFGEIKQISIVGQSLFIFVSSIISKRSIKC